ncbi:MAG: excinuclease ABC subunit UvrC [Bacillota bacterium]
MNEQITEKLKKLPASPGVYVMTDKMGNIIYVGKAKVLKNRVRQYFHSSVKTEKVLAMVREVDDFYYHITKSEQDALILENNLIKKHKPRYNILLKDDKTYPYIKFTKEEFPKLEITRKIKKGDGKYFGPYMGGVSARELVDIIQDTFYIRSCKVNMKKIPKNHRVCLNYQMGRCKGICQHMISSEEYSMLVKSAMNFLKGETKETSEKLQIQMTDAAKRADFERAILYRDRLDSIKKIKDRKLTASMIGVDIDIFAVASNGVSNVVSLLIIRQGRMQGVENFYEESVFSEKEETLANFMLSHYEKNIIPDEIITEFEIGKYFNLEEHFEEIHGKKTPFLVPKMGLRAQLVDMAKENAEDYLEKNASEKTREFEKTIGASNLLSSILGYPVSKMECYDISNISGTLSVASMVVFIDGKPQNKLYRRFKIKTVEGPNDFASMNEVIKRRFTRLLDENETDESFSVKPDLVVIDGGMIQLEFAGNAIKSLGVTQNMVSLAKREEEIFLPNSKTPILLEKSNNALKILQQIRDESHRFAITFHRTLRNKNAFTSILDSISGIGTAKKKLIFEKYQTPAEIASASVSDISEIKGVTENLARDIKEKAESYLKKQTVLEEKLNLD